VSVVITGVNDRPQAVNDLLWIYAGENTTNLEVRLLANDTDPDVGDTKQITAAGAPITGAVDLDLSGNLTYTASGFDWLAGGVTAIDTFTYTMQDGSGESSDATVTAVVTGLNKLHVGGLISQSIKGSGDWTAVVTVTVHDSSDNPVASAVVTGTWSVGTPGEGTCTTNGSGQCAISTVIPNNEKSTQFEVTGVTKSMWIYTPAANPPEVGDPATILVDGP
jgi:hypothetical protein